MILWFQRFFLGIVLVVVPLALRAVEVADSPSAFKAYTFGTAQYEFFYGFKSYLLMFAGLGLGLLRFPINSLNRTNILKLLRQPGAPLWWLGCWVVVTTISSLAGEHRDVIWYGGLMQRDGLGVQWSYALLCYFGYQGARSRAFQSTVVFCLGLSTILIGMLGWSQIQGISYMEAPWFRWLVIPPKLQASLQITQVGLGGISGFLGNPNDMAFFCALLVPFWASHMLLVRTKRAFVVSGLFTMTALAMALSSAGVGGGFGWMIALMGLMSLVALRWYPHCQVSLSVLPGFVLAALVGSYLVLWKFPQVLPGFVIKPKEVLSLVSQARAGTPVQLAGGLYLEDKRLFVTHWQPGFIIEPMPQGFRLMDLGFRPLLVEGMGSWIRVKDLHFLDISLHKLEDPVSETQGISVFRVEKGDQNFTFATTTSGLRVLVNQSLIKPLQGRRLNLPLGDHLLSHRIYIWTRVIPVILDRWLLGHGVGGFILDFPNRDVISMDKTFGPHVFVDRPHNIYLQQAYQGGLVGLMGFLVLYWGALGRSLKKIYFCPDSFTVAMTLGLCGMAIAGCAYDLGVALGGTFWLLVGATAALGSVDRPQKQNTRHEILR